MSDFQTVDGTNAAFTFADHDIFGIPDYQVPLAGSTAGVPQPTGADASQAPADTVSNQAAALSTRPAHDHPLFWSAILVSLGFVGLAVATGMAEGGGGE